MQIDIDSSHPGVLVIGVNGVGYPQDRTCVVAKNLHMFKLRFDDFRHLLNRGCAADVYFNK